MRKQLLVACVLSLACVSQSTAADVKFGGQMFAQYGIVGSKRNSGASEAKGAAAFDVSRLAITAEAKLDEHWNGKATIEGQTTGTAPTSAAAPVAGNEPAMLAQAGQNAVYLKQAWIGYANLLDKGVNIQLGQIPHIWYGTDEGIWGRRYVARTQTEQEGYISAWDKGVSVMGGLPMGYGTLGVEYMNGEGTRAGEPGTASAATANTNATTAGQLQRGKDVVFRLTLVPVPQNDMLKGFQLHAVAQKGSVAPTAYVTVANQGGALPSDRRRDRTIGAVSFKNDYGHLMYSYFYAYTGSATTDFTYNKSQGYSLHGSANLGKVVPMLAGVSLFARHDRSETGARARPTNGLSYVTQQTAYLPSTFTVAGIEKVFNPNVKFALDVQNLKTCSASSPNPSQPSQTITINREVKYYVHAELKF